MKVVLIEEEGSNKQGASVGTGRGGGSSAVAILLGYIPRGNKALETIDRS